MNDGIDYFENYPGQEISFESYKEESKKYMVRGLKELDYYNKMIYNSLNKLDEKDTLEKTSYLKNVTLLFDNNNTQNFSLRQSIEILKSIGSNVLDIPTNEINRSNPHVNWIMVNSNLRIRSQV